ncbi:MAG: hypothetical protein GXO49_07690, partial [Chlorobi bacterium]|nr:hypothetical protein [Chlorobiota bacterium]
MFNNKILLFVSAIAVSLVIVFFTYMGKTKKELSPVINAIPIKASVIVETEDF